MNVEQIMMLVREYGMHFAEASLHQSSSKADVSHASALKKLGEIRAALAQTAAPPQAAAQAPAAQAAAAPQYTFCRHGQPMCDQCAASADFGERYVREWAEYWRERALAAEAAQAAQPTLTNRLQQKCSDWGSYWRASDAHGVNLTPEQATELLRDALGVEVEIAVQPDVVSNEARLYRAVRTVCGQAGVPPQQFVEWLCDGGLAQMALSHFSDPAAQAAHSAPVAWLDPADLETLEADGWCVVHAAQCDPGSDHAADIPLYMPAATQTPRPNEPADES